MGRMQFEVGGTWGVMEMSCLDTSEGFHCINPKTMMLHCDRGCCHNLHCRRFLLRMQEHHCWCS